MTTPITVADLTAGSVGGNGVFDQLMKANLAHLEQEFNKNRITGADYAKVYLGLIESTMQGAVSFLVERDQIAFKADLLAKQIAAADKQMALTDQQIANAVLEGKVLVAQECKLRAEYDLTMANVTRTGKEIDLLNQKIATEKAQTLGLGVDDDSIIGKQKKLYQAQTDGFARDSEQKMAKIMIDTWSSRRMTDDGTVADGVNKLDDGHIGRAVEKLLTGAGA